MVCQVSFKCLIEIHSYMLQFKFKIAVNLQRDALLCRAAHPVMLLAATSLDLRDALAIVPRRAAKN